MKRRKRTRTEQEQLKNAKQMHKKDQRLNPTWFEAKRIDMGSEILTEITKRTPRWGSFKFNFTKTGI